MGERIVFISDVHLGDVCYNEEIEKRFLNFLEGVAADASELVITGDLFEMSQKSMTEIIIRAGRSISALWNYAKKVKVKYVVGNHDLFFAKLLGSAENIEILYPSYRKNVDGVSIHAEHGHLYQKEYRGNPEVYNLVARFGRFTDAISPNIEDILGDMFKGFKHIKDICHPSQQEAGDKSLNDYEEQANLLGEEGAGIVIFGHTHEPYIKKLSSGVTYVNTGDWIRLSHCNYAVFENGEINLYSYPQEKIDLSS